MFLTEFQRYARQQYPYDTVIEDSQSPLHWWASIEGTEFAKILPVLARKIFAVRVNSMPEERTVSSFTWLTSPLRANMLMSSMVNMTKIRQYYQTEQKARANSLPVPRMLYIDARKKLNEKLRENKDEEDDSWLDDKPGDGNEAEVSPEVALEARTSSLIDFDCKLLSGILSDTRPAKKLTTENKSATLAISPQQEGIIDNNFYLNI
ncbi:hypothetical protein F5887DRAFT_151909 [Amanita rubescens]|nr:hypothetical protein F5887DRAFT_151909 [Amanita rubescens]